MYGAQRLVNHVIWGVAKTILFDDNQCKQQEGESTDHWEQ